MKNRKKGPKDPKIEVCATPAGPCIAAEGRQLKPVVVAVGTVAVAVAVAKLIKVLRS